MLSCNPSTQEAEAKNSELETSLRATTNKKEGKVERQGNVLLQSFKLYRA